MIAYISQSLTDDGAILNDLIISGFDIKSKRRNEILKSIIRSYGISISNNNELTVNCSIEDLPIKKHLLAQCMIKVNDMFFYQKTQCNLYSLKTLKLEFACPMCRHISVCVFYYIQKKLLRV